MTVNEVTPASKVDRIFDEANRFLGHIVTAAENLEINLPETRYIYVGEVVHDCPQVVVSIATGGTGLPQANNQALAMGQFAPGGMPPVWNITLACDIVRKGPKMTNRGTVPYSEQTDLAKQCSRDAAVLFEAVELHLRNYFGNLETRLTFLEMQGALYGTRASVTLAVH